MNMAEVQKVTIKRFYERGKVETAQVEVLYVDGSKEEYKGVQAVEAAKEWTEQMEDNPISGVVEETP